MPSLWSRLKGLLARRTPSDPFVVALVALFSAPRAVEPSALVAAIVRGFGEAPTDVEGEGIEVRFTLAGIRLRAYGVPAPYLAPGADQEAKAAEFTELRLRAAFAEHRAWYAIDTLSGDPATGYAVAGRLLAELLDETALAVLAPGAGGAPVDDDVRQAFREGRAEELVTGLRYDAITGVQASDPRMEAAIAEARRRWPEFAAAFAARSSDESPFIVKYPFAHGEEVEHMWVKVDGIDGGHVVGTSMNQPFFLPRPRQGDRVEIEAAKVSDWAFLGPDGPVGSFSEAVVRGA